MNIQPDKFVATFQQVLEWIPKTRKIGYKL